MIAIDLKVPAYLKTYLTSVYGNDYVVNGNDALGVLVLNCLKKKSIYYKHVVSKDRGSFFRLSMSLSMFEKQGCTISEEQLTQICKNIDQNFRSMIYTSAIVNKEYLGIPYKETIISFLMSYNFNESELSYPTIRKDFNRKKIKIVNHLNFSGHI